MIFYQCSIQLSKTHCLELRLDYCSFRCYLRLTSAQFSAAEHLSTRLVGGSILISVIKSISSNCYQQVDSSSSLSTNSSSIKLNYSVIGAIPKTKRFGCDLDAINGSKPGWSPGRSGLCCAETISMTCQVVWLPCSLSCMPAPSFVLCLYEQMCN